MDFAALMSKEIAKKKGGGTSTSSSTTTTTTADSKKQQEAPASAPAPPKFISRRELEEQRKAAYLAEQKRLEEERAAKAALKRKREEEAAEEAKAREEKRQRLAEESRLRREAREAEEERQRRKRLGLPEIPPKDDKTDEDTKDKDEDSDLDDLAGEQPDLSPEDLAAKLRALGEPVALFGESHSTRLKRYHKISLGLNTPSGPISTTLLPVPEKDMKLPTTVPPPTEKKARRLLYRQLASYFNLVLREWEIALSRESNTDTFAGQAAKNAMISSKETMRPLFRKFEKGDLDEEILTAIVEIVNAAQERRYVDANDGYLRLSIGKAAWPIGVTMVGIHERSAREKLHDGAKGHIMGGEVTRKYLQSIKRCLTFAQVRWPPEDIRQLMG